MRKVGILGLAAVGMALVTLPSIAAGEERSFTIANVDYEGSKMFIPSTLIVNRGDKVKLRLVNNIPGDPNQHGFSIPDYKIEKVVTRGEPQEVEFVADRPGLFPIKCQLHPAHLGGQLLVRGGGGGGGGEGAKK